MKLSKKLTNSIWYSSWIDTIKSIYPDFSINPETNSASVKSCDLTDGKIVALIKDASNNTFSTTLELAQFSDAQKERIQEGLKHNISTAYELNYGYIPDNLIASLEKKDINLFPTTQDEINITCSCNKSGLCEHIYALLYYLSSEISKSPDLILNLRGLSHEEILSFTEFVDEAKEKSLKTGIKLLDLDSVSLDMSSIPDKQYKYDFSFPKNSVEDMFAILEPNPDFFPKADFKNRLKTVYEIVVSDVDAIITKENVTPVRDSEFYFYLIDKNYKKIFISPSNNFIYYLKSKGSRYKYDPITMKVPQIVDGKAELVDKEGIIIDSEIVFDYFLALPKVDDNVSETANFLFLIANFATELVRSASFVPEVEYLDENNFNIKYVPFKNDVIQKELDNLKAITPEIIGFIEDKILSKDAFYNILSIYLTHIIQKIAFLRTTKIKPNYVTNIFIKNFSIKAYNNTKNQAKAISLWLTPLNIQNCSIHPVIRINSLSNNRFTIDLDFINENDIDKTVPIPEIIKNRGCLIQVLKQLITASGYMPELEKIFGRSEKTEFTITEVFALISEKAYALSKLKIKIIIPRELKNLPKPKLSIKARYKHNKVNLNDIISGKNESSISIDDLFEFSYEIAIGDQKISREEFMALIKSTENIVNFKDQYVILDQEEIKKIMSSLDKPIDKFTNINDFIHSALSGFVDEIAFDYDEALKRALDELEDVKDIEIPHSLNGKLRPYQERGFKWLYSNTQRGFGSCIADDMGLGKTVQALTLILKLKEENKLNKPILVVCPTTLVGNWQKECQKFAPSLSVSIFHGTERVLEVDKADVIITTYGLLRQDIDIFNDNEWGMILVDEAQNIKNPDTAQTIAVKNLKADIHIAMTGTPVENRLAELWSIFDFTNKGFLKTLNNFQNNYAVPIEKQRDEDAVNRLKKVTSPFVLRRLKNDKSIISDLPEKVIIDEYCYLSPDQAALYEKTLNNTMKNIEGSHGINRRGLIFKLITSLKQICNHPTHYTKGSNLDRNLSGKTDKALDLIQDIIEMNEKVLIFTQYKEMGDLLVRIIRNELSEEALFFHGSVQRNKREELIDIFQENPASKIMVISLKAGGTGLNLTAATNVIHYDLWWNPAVEDQATDRAYRIGQTKNVNVHRLITLGTFEEKIDEMIKSKKELANLTISTGENWITELSDKELKDIFSLGI